MDKNANVDTGDFVSKYGWNIMIAISAFFGGLTNLFAQMNFLIGFIVSFLVLLLVIHIINEIRWAGKRKNGFVKIEESSSEGRYGKENFAWLTLSPKNETEILKIHIRAIRGIYGRKISLSDLTDIKRGNVYIVKDLVLDGYPKRIPLFSIIEDCAYLFTQNEVLGENGKIPFRILLNKEDALSEENFEIVLEISGRINDKYMFQEFRKGIVSYNCSTEPDIIEGTDTSPIYHRSCEIKWVDFRDWSTEEESKRPILREMRNLADRTV